MEKINFESLINPRTDAEVAQAIRTAGTYLNKEFFNLRSNNIATEDLYIQLVECNAIRTMQERLSDETRLREYYEAKLEKEAKVSAEGRFAIHPEYREEYHDKSSDELKAALERVNRDLAKLQEDKKTYTNTIAESTRALEKIDHDWDNRQDSFAKKFVHDLSVNRPELKYLATPEMEEAVKAASPVKILKVNPELAERATAEAMNAMNDIGRQLRAGTCVCRADFKDKVVDRGESTEAEYFPTVKERLAAINKINIPVNIKGEVDEIAKALDATKICKEAKHNLVQVKNEIESHTKEATRILKALANIEITETKRPGLRGGF